MATNNNQSLSLSLLSTQLVARYHPFNHSIPIPIPFSFPLPFHDNDRWLCLWQVSQSTSHPVAESAIRPGGNRKSNALCKCKLEMGNGKCNMHKTHCWHRAIRGKSVWSNPWLTTGRECENHTNITLAKFVIDWFSGSEKYFEGTRFNWIILREMWKIWYVLEGSQNLTHHFPMAI